MSRIGRLAVEFEAPVELAVAGDVVKVSGPKGELSLCLPKQIKVKVEEGPATGSGQGRVVVERESDEPACRALHGLVRSTIFNMVKGVKEGWSKRLELVGTGYRASMEGKTLVLSVGYSQPVKVVPEEGVEFEIGENTKITVRGVDKMKVGQVAAKIRALRPPEPYKGKGIRYEGEVVRRKPGKAAAKMGTTAAQ